MEGIRFVIQGLALQCSSSAYLSCWLGSGMPPTPGNPIWAAFSPRPPERFSPSQDPAKAFNRTLQPQGGANGGQHLLNKTTHQESATNEPPLEVQLAAGANCSPNSRFFGIGSTMFSPWMTVWALRILNVKTGPGGARGAPPQKVLSIGSAWVVQSN